MQTILFHFNQLVEEITDKATFSTDQDEVWYLELGSKTCSGATTKAEFIIQNNLLPNRSDEEQPVLLIAVDDMATELLSYEQYRMDFASLGYELVIRQAVTPSSFFGPPGRILPGKIIRENTSTDSPIATHENRIWAAPRNNGSNTGASIIDDMPTDDMGPSTSTS